MAPLRPLLLSLLRLFCLSFFLFFAHSHLPPVLHLSFIHSQLFSSLSFVYCHLLSSVSFFVCSFIPTFCFFFFYPLFFFFIQSHLLWILFVSFVHSHLLFCSVSFLFVGSLAPSFILFRFFVHSHLLPILSFVYLHLPSYIRTFFLFCFFLRLFAPSFYCFIRLHLLSFMLLSCVVYHIYSILFIFFIHSHLLSILNVSLIPSCFPCFAVSIPSDIVFVLFISLLPLHLLSARLSVFLCLKIPLLNKGNSLNSTSTTAQPRLLLLLAKTIILYQPRLLLYLPRRTRTLSLPLEQ